ncbi:unnamed protein product [Camellia sinensis]
MDVRMKNNNNKAAAPFSFPKMRPTTTPPLVVDGKKVLYHRSFSQGQGHARRIFPFSIESSLLLVCLTASLLILPLILPPLPPPAFHAAAAPHWDSGCAYDIGFYAFF